MGYKNVKTTERMVRWVLETFPDARKTDKELLLAYMNLCGISLNAHQRAAFKAMPSFESLTRCRRKLQEQGEYLPPQPIAEERQAKADMYKQEMMNWDV